MEESILLSSDSNPSSPAVLLEEDQDLDIPKVKLSEILGYKNSNSGFLKTKVSSTSSYSGGVCSIEPIASTSNYVPPSTVSEVPQGSDSDHNLVSAWSSWECKSLPLTSGITKNVEPATSPFVHQLSDSDAGLSDFLSDSENEPISNKVGDELSKKSAVNDFCQAESAEEHSKWISLMDEDTEPPSSRSSSTLPPDQLPDTLNPSISSCSTLPPHRPPDPLLVSSDSSSTLPPDAVQSNFFRTVTKFEKKPSFHDISDSDDGSSDTIENVPEPCPDTYISGKDKFSYSKDISLSEDDSNPPSASSSTLPPLHCDRSAELLTLHSEPILSSSYSISEFISQLGTNSQPVTSTASLPLMSQKKPRSNVNDVFERKRIKELKMKEKADRAALAERVRRMKPGECMKYVTVILDQNIVSEYPWAPAVIEILRSSGVKHSVEVATDPCTVKWTREQTDKLVPQQENHVLFLWSTEKLLTSVRFGTLGETFSEFKKKYENNKLYLCVHGLHDYYRKFHRAKQRQNKSAEPHQRKRKSNYEITPDQLEMELIALQIKFRISHKILSSPQDTAHFLQVITKSVAEMPFKLEKEKMEMERNWYAKGDSKKCVRIDKNFNGLRQLWLQHLSQFNLSSLDIAKSIAELYPTPLSLFNAYRQCSSSKEKEQMLQEIVVKRGPGDGGRRLGPELSRKISFMFCQDDDLPLG